MTTPKVHTERIDDVVVVHLDDGKANALSFEVIAAIGDAVAAAESDDSVVAVVLHGREGRFSAGFDLGVMRGDDITAIVSLVSDGGDLVLQLYGSSVPVVAACTGHALAAGALLLLGCDLRIGADVDCKIGLNEVAIGLVLPNWALTIAGERLSRRHLQRAVATAVVTDARGARDAGFLDEVVPGPELLDTAIERARAFASLDRRAYAGTVTALRGAALATMRCQIDDDRSSGSAPTS
ncbi:MAG TPA: crotonase/enoyl-CoA hydratase family protein [Ilumatobacteraceae bacterium]